jgi:hypothetical protein
LDKVQREGERERERGGFRRGGGVERVGEREREVERELWVVGGEPPSQRDGEGE